MPTTRLRRRRLARPGLSHAQLAWLRDGDPTSDLSLDLDVMEFNRFIWLSGSHGDDPDKPLRDGSAGPRALWAQYGEAILAEQISEFPGRRPNGWWRFQDREPRQRLGGIGTPEFEVLGIVPRYVLGVPADWVKKWEIQYCGEGFAGVLIDPDDPPIYESQAAYLDRHNLFVPGERRRLTEADFEPELITDILDFGN